MAPRRKFPGQDRPFVAATLGLLLAAALPLLGWWAVTTFRAEHRPPPTTAQLSPPPTAVPPAPAPLPTSVADARQALFAAMRKGYADAAPDAPNLLDLLSERFPADRDRLMTELIAIPGRTPQDAAHAGAGAIAKTFVAIQQRDGDKLEQAPAPALRRLMTAERDLLAAVAANGGLSCVEAVQAPTPGIARLAVISLYDRLDAIAEGRDHPVSRATRTRDDFIAFVRAAQRKGIDVSQWAGVSDPRAPPARVCQDLIGMYDAALQTDGALGERILAAFAEDHLVKSLDAYQPVLK